jgi:type I restriction enzyme S subunit
MKRWPTKPLGEIAGAGQYGLNAPAMSEGTGVRFVRITDITQSGELRHEAPAFVPANTPELSDYELSEGDVLIARSGATAGKSYVHRSFGERAVFAGYLIRFQPDTARVHSRFIGAFLQTPDYWQQLNSHKRAVAQPNVNAKQLASLVIPVPPLAEQERIVALLDEADALRKLRAQADRRTAALLPALFHEMFGDPVSNSGRFPTARLGQIASVERGRFSPRPRNDPSYYGGDYPFIQTGDIAESGGYLTRWRQTLNERGRSVSKEFPPGTIVIAIVGATIGQTAILGRPMHATDSVVGIQPQPDRALAEYIIAVLRHWRPVFIAQAPETARANLNAATLKAVELPLPPLPLQQQFAQRVAEIRELEAAQAASRLRLESLFQSMLHRAFNGAL